VGDGSEDAGDLLGLGSAENCPSKVWGTAPAEIKFGGF